MLHHVHVFCSVSLTRSAFESGVDITGQPLAVNATILPVIRGFHGDGVNGCFHRRSSLGCMMCHCHLSDCVAPV